MVQNALCSPPGHGIRVILLAIGLYGNMEQVRGNGLASDTTETQKQSVWTAPENARSTDLCHTNFRNP